MKHRPLLWCREALEAHRLIPPDEVAGQACWCCGREPVKTMFGWQPKLVEIIDAYGRLVLCIDCLMHHLSRLKTKQGKARLTTKEEAKTPWIRRKAPAKKRRLPTFKEWAATATLEEVQAVLEKMKARMKGEK